VQEKEQLLKELRNASSAAEVVTCRIRQLQHDLQQHAIDYNSQQFDADKYVCLFDTVSHSTCGDRALYVAGPVTSSSTSSLCNPSLSTDSF